MASTYEFWLLDDRGRRMVLLRNMSFFSYSKSVNGFGALEIGFPYRDYVKLVPTVFQPDWRIDVWRSPKTGVPMRREGMWLLRMPRMYTREDGTQIIVIYGRDAKDLLQRRYIIQPAGTSYTRKQDNIDDMMKALVREQCLWGTATGVEMTVDYDRPYPEDEFLVQGDHALGPIIARTFSERNLMDSLKELQDASRRLYQVDSTVNRKIYFDVVAVDLRGWIIEILDEQTGTAILDEQGEALLDESSNSSGADIGFMFITKAGLYGQDRTDGIPFSIENNNIKEVAYAVNRFEERNSVIVKGFGRGDSREWAIVDDSDAIRQSRWNRIEAFHDASTEPDQTRLEDFGYPVLSENKAKETISCTFLNVGGSDDTPESLYGIQWDLGDLLPVYYADKWFAVEVEVVYVAMDENGMETITGRTEVDNVPNPA